MSAVKKQETLAQWVRSAISTYFQNAGDHATAEELFAGLLAMNDKGFDGLAVTEVDIPTAYRSDNPHSSYIRIEYKCDRVCVVGDGTVYGEDSDGCPVFLYQESFYFRTKVTDAEVKHHSVPARVHVGSQSSGNGRHCAFIH